MKHEWRKQEKNIYLAGKMPRIMTIPPYHFLVLSGEGNPNSEEFASCISALYAVSYAIKMTLKKEDVFPQHTDYTVYPLEGVWDINEEAKRTFNGILNKDDLVFDLMIRQPDYLSSEFVAEMIALTQKKKPHPLLQGLKWEKREEGKCIQYIHTGPYDDEPASFSLMEQFAAEHGLERLSKKHREIYLSDFRKVAPEKLKTVLRFGVA